MNKCDRSKQRKERPKKTDVKKHVKSEFVFSVVEQDKMGGIFNQLIGFFPLTYQRYFGWLIALFSLHI